LTDRDRDSSWLVWIESYWFAGINLAEVAPSGALIATN
jgi:hypothetical protein